MLSISCPETLFGELLLFLQTFQPSGVVKYPAYSPGDSRSPGELLECKLRRPEKDTLLPVANCGDLKRILFCFALTAAT